MWYLGAAEQTDLPDMPVSRQLLVLLARGEDPLLTLQTCDHYFLTTMVNAMYGPPPRGGHQVFFVNTLKPYTHYRRTADFGIVYYSRRVRADPRFQQAQQHLDRAYAECIVDSRRTRPTSFDRLDELMSACWASGQDEDGPRPSIKSVSFFENYVEKRTVKFDDASAHAL